MPVYEAGEIDGELFIAMRYVDGHDLSDDRRPSGRAAVAWRSRIVRHRRRALDAAHAAGLVHRDVKPGNVLLGPAPTGAPRLPDRLRPDQAPGRAALDDRAPGQIVGSIGYVAPEQVEGRPVDGRTDVYSLGCLAYECLAGSPPFRRDTEMASL